MGARAAWIDIDLDAVRHNVGYLRSLVGEAKVMVVVKANGYGHGAVQVAEAALEAGAHGLCVALVQEELNYGAPELKVRFLFCPNSLLIKWVTSSHMV